VSQNVPNTGLLPSHPTLERQRNVPHFFTYPLSHDIFTKRALPSHYEFKNVKLPTMLNFVEARFTGDGKPSPTRHFSLKIIFFIFYFLSKSKFWCHIRTCFLIEKLFFNKKCRLEDEKRPHKSFSNFVSLLLCLRNDTGYVRVFFFLVSYYQFIWLVFHFLFYFLQSYKE